MTVNLKHALWVEKHRPATLDEYVFQNDRHREQFKAMIDNQSIPQLILAGMRGTGKSTVARILMDSMGLDDSDIQTINASSERGIETFRNKIEGFAKSMAMGRFKILLLEEADKLTPDAQAALKAFMEDVSDSVRFIFTTNHINKIMPEIRSRCQEFFFKSSDQVDITEQMANILAREKVKFKLADLDGYIVAGYPDMRKIINLLQQNTINGVLLNITEGAGSAGEWKIGLIDLIQTDNWAEARKLVCSSASADEWEDLYRFLYENIDRAPKFKLQDKWEQAIVVIAEHLYKHTLVADPEINAAAMLITLGQI